MQKTKIEWVKNLDGSEGYVWNPLVGCKHACPYCYAERLNKRFHFIRKWNEPKYFIRKLRDPFSLKKPSKIFVCSMADLFGEWVPAEWIQNIIDVVNNSPQHIFMFLTKNPKRYLEFEFPLNCWFGVTITGGENSKIANEKINVLRKKRIINGVGVFNSFISIEPLLGDVSRLDLKGIDLVIVGAMTGPGSVVPEKEWIKSIKHKNIFYKSNIKKYL